VIAITLIGFDPTYMPSERLRGQQEAAMRKHVSFAIGATLLVLAMVFWSISGVVQTTASSGRSKAVVPTYRVIQVQPNAYLPNRSMEPVY
jgi:drug/metabolite transporter (DMT)-like permease